MIPIYYDFHLHSCLSPCGSEDMTPANIAGMALVNGLQAFALTDHNTAKNCPAAAAHAKEYGLTFLPGMELTTQEEVHVLCLFARVEDALAFDSYVHERIQPVENKPDYFGHETIMNEKDEPVGEEPLLLINATTISFDSLQGLVEKYGGVMVPAHIDKSSNALLANLGFVPPDSHFTTVEYAHIENAERLEKENPYLASCRKITDSDAHYLENVNQAVNILHVKENTPEAILEVLRSGRSKRTE